jgi:hypothetical protein
MQEVEAGITIKEEDRDDITVIAGELEGNRRDCNTMEKQHGRR